MIDSSEDSGQSQQPSAEIARVNRVNDSGSETAVEAMGALFDGIRKYNDQFSVGRILARLIINVVERESSGLADGSNPLIKEINDQEVSAITVLYQNKPILDQIGLTLDSTSGEKVASSDKEMNVNAGLLELSVADGKQFVSFLSGLNLDQVMNTSLKDNLKEISKVLINRIRNRYNLFQPEDEALQLLSNMADIVGQYKRLGLGDSNKKMENYLIHMRQGVLREYVEIEKNGYLESSDGGRGPAKWQFDSTPESLRRYWNEALMVLKAISYNPKARVVYEILKNNLVDCVDVAILGVLEGLNGKKEGKLDGIFKIEILKEMKTRLDKDFK